MDKTLIKLTLAIMTTLLSCCACGMAASTAPQAPVEIEAPVSTMRQTAAPAPAPTTAPTQTPVPTPEPTPQTAELGFVGDIMVMTSQITEAKTDAGFDFSRSFAGVSGLFGAMDIMCGNFECTFAGAEAGYTQPRATAAPVTEANPSPTRPPFQRFNAPDELARDLALAGFDMLSSVNNHCLDMGADGLYRTARVIREAGIVQLGTYLDAADAASPRVVEVNGIKVGFIAATDIINSGTPGLGEEERGYAIARLSDTEKLKAMADACRGAGAEFVVALVHWGNEYENSSNRTQRGYADALIGIGVDAIMGSHPHVVQELEWREAMRDGESVRVPVAYSMGNFLSNMTRQYNEYGVFVRLTLIRAGDGRVRCTGLAYLPLLCYRDTVRLVQPCFEDSEGAFLSAFEHVRSICSGEGIDLITREEAACIAG